jgi:hypothetical protein
MDKSVQIFLEGNSDKKFFTDYIQFLFPEKSEKFIIIDVGGKNKLHLSKNEFKKNTDAGGINLVIFDADGDFENRKKELEAKKIELGLSFELFLLPNHNGIGDFEDLLVAVSNQKHKQIFNCFEEYQGCLTKHDQGYTLPNKKAKVYAYLEALLPVSENENIRIGKRDYLNAEHWDLNHPFLNPLKAFLEKYL